MEFYEVEKQIDNQLRLGRIKNATIVTFMSVGLLGILWFMFIAMGRVSSFVNTYFDTIK